MIPPVPGSPWITDRGLRSSRPWWLPFLGEVLDNHEVRAWGEADREEGSHADLLARGGLYARLYQRQFGEDLTEMSPLL